MSGFKLIGDKVKLSENDVEDAILDVLGYRHVLPVRLHCGRCQTPPPRRQWLTLMPAGTPDYVVIDPHRPAYFVEAKAPGGKLSEVQVRMHEMLRVAEFEVVTVHSVEEMAEWLRRHERSP